MLEVKEPKVNELKPAPKMKKYDRTCLSSQARRWIMKLEEMTGNEAGKMEVTRTGAIKVTMTKKIEGRKARVEVEQYILMSKEDLRKGLKIRGPMAIIPIGKGY